MSMIYHAHRQGATWRAFRSRASRGAVREHSVRRDGGRASGAVLLVSAVASGRVSHLSCPELPEGHAPTLPRLETKYCRKLDLYFSFSKAFEYPIDRDALYDKREGYKGNINRPALQSQKQHPLLRAAAALRSTQSGRLYQAATGRSAPCAVRRGGKSAVPPSFGRHGLSLSKSLAEFAPAGANKLQNILPAACTSAKILLGSQRRADGNSTGRGEPAFSNESPTR